jgi:hypothetical protein
VKLSFIICPSQLLNFFFPLGQNIFLIDSYTLLITVNFFSLRMRNEHIRTPTQSFCGGIKSPEVTEMKYWNDC